MGNLLLRVPNIAIYSTKDDQVIVHPSNSADVSQLMPCDHIEAGSRIFLHIFDAAHQSHNNIYIRKVDSDIVVIAVCHFTSPRLTELWAGFDSGKRQSLSMQLLTNWVLKSAYLSHSFTASTGCDTSSPLLGIGKRTARAA